MSFDERYAHTPGGPLAGLVARATGYHHAGHAPGVHLGLPSATLTVVLPFDGPLRLSTGSGPVTGHDAVVAGLHTTPTLIHHDGTQHGIQLALRPGAARALLGVPAAVLAEGSFELTDVAAYRSLRDRLHELPTWECRFAALDAALTAALRRTGDRTAPAPEVVEAWRLIQRSGGAVRVREVARQVGWSTRHLQDRFRAELGVTPKQAARVRRFEHSAALVRARPELRLAEVAARCGYADQAHLARDWRALAGSSATDWRRIDDLAFVQDTEGRAEEHGGHERQHTH